ncbi:hypothetical protein Tco_0573704 [Tanacetum coccineum]
MVRVTSVLNDVNGKGKTEEEDPFPIDVPRNTKEEYPLPIDVPMQTEEEDPLPLDILHPLQEIASSSMGTSTRGEARYGLRSLGPIQEEVVMVKKLYSLVKVTNAILGLRAPKAEVGCSGYGRKRNS